MPVSPHLFFSFFVQCEMFRNDFQVEREAREALNAEKERFRESYEKLLAEHEHLKVRNSNVFFRSFLFLLLCRRRLYSLG